MNELVEKLLLPVSAEQPCGPDLSNDPRFVELETLLKGKPEVDIGSVKKPPEPPDWGKLTEKCAEFLPHSKHLGAAAMMCCGLLKTGGLAGFLDGLQLVHGLTERYWATVYPLLDATDNNDPTQRLNALISLTSPRGSVTGWLRIIDYLYEVPLCRPSKPKGAPEVKFEDLDAINKRNIAAGATPPSASDSALTEAIRSTEGDPIGAHCKTLDEALKTAQGLDTFLTGALGAGNTISFEVLQTTLKEMRTGLEPYRAVTGADTTSGVGGTAGPESIGIAVSGAIRRRDDVVQAIDHICAYYEQVERCSPVPYLLRRAQKLAKMDFVQAVQELNLATVDSLRPSMGSAVDTAAPSGGNAPGA